MAVKTYSLKKDGNTKVATNFSVKEFARWDTKWAKDKYCGDEVKIDSTTVDFLQKIRSHFRKYTEITSGYRPTGYNSAIGGASGSLHITGQAVDFYISGVDVKEIAKYAESLGCPGIGCYTSQRFVHIDSRAVKYFWRNDGKGNYTVSTHGGTPPTPAPPLSGVAEIKQIQKSLNDKYSVGLVVDGIYGSNTRTAVIKGLQTELNKQFNAKLVVDGKWGAQTQSKIVTLKQKDKGNITYLLQSALYFRDYKLTVDGDFGTATLDVVKRFQRANGLVADGLVGRNTWNRLLA